jgi:tetratricopeptide (TPR) repeat protein
MSIRKKVGMLLLGLIACAVVGSALVYLAWPLVNYLFLSLPGLDKVAHFVAGALFWWLIFWSQKFVLPTTPQRTRATIAFVVTTTIVLGDEFLQTFSSLRTVDWQDPLSGLAGSMLAFAIASFSLSAASTLMVVLATSILMYTARATYVRDHYYFEAILLERGYEHEEAYERYKLALAAAPDMAGIYNSVAWLCLEHLQRDYGKALQWAQTGLEFDPDNADMRDTLGWAYYKNGHFDEALEHVSFAASRSPGNSVIREHLQIIQAELAAKSR